MGKDFYTGTDAELYTGSNVFSTAINEAFGDYGIPEPSAIAYAALNSSFGTKYLAAINPELRTKGRVAAKNDAKKLLKAAAADLARIINGTPSVTDQQKIDLGLNVRKNPSPNPRPIVRPGVDMVSVNGRTVSIHIHDSASSSKRGKPADTTAAWVYTFVGAEYPSDPTLWDFNGSATTGKFEIVFPNTLAGGTQVWVCAAWINGKQEAGPTSVPITTNLQGGGTSAQGAMQIAA